MLVTKEGMEVREQILVSVVQSQTMTVLVHAGFQHQEQNMLIRQNNRSMVVNYVSLTEKHAAHDQNLLARLKTVLAYMYLPTVLCRSVV